MRITLALLCYFVATMTGFSQDKSFDLNNYQFPDYIRHQLDLTLKSDGSSNSRWVNNYTDMDNVVKVEMKDYNNQSNLGLTYQYDYLTRKSISNFISFIAGDYNYSMHQLGDEKTTESKPYLQWTAKGFSRYYLIEKKLFIEGNADLRYSYRKSNITTPHANSDEAFRYNTMDVAVGLGIGSGRMEKVSDLWQAYYILAKLDKQKSLSRQLEEKDVFEFASLTSELKNKRILDFRTRRIIELKELDSLLHQQELIEESDISYFTTLNDYWSYGNFQNRESGRELKFWVTPHYVKNEQKTDPFDEISEHYTNVIGYISLDCNKQINLYWERRFMALAFYNKMLEDEKTYLVYPKHDLHTVVNIGYGFFPNSRTNINGDLTYFGRNIVESNFQNIETDKWSHRVDFRLLANYYFSPHLQLAAYYSISRDRINIEDEGYSNYGLVLKYAIF